MTDDEQLARFGEAVEQKNEEAKEASERQGAQNPSGDHIDGDQPTLTEPGRTQDVQDQRAKNSGHGQVTADKWNQ
jgi:hypothetical protein